MIQFAHPELLWLLLLLPIAAFFAARGGSTPAVRFSGVALARDVGRSPRARLMSLMRWLRLPAAALVVVALAQPQRDRSKHQIEASGVDIMLAIDVSGSMEAQDLELDGARANRLEVTKSVVRDFVERRPNDRIGIVAFGGAPFLVSPLTLDHQWLLSNLDRLKIGMVEDGTAVGWAVASSVERLEHEDAKSKLVVLLTDGVDNIQKISPQLAAEAAKTLGVKVYTVGVGVQGRAPIPVKDELGRTKMVMADVEVDEPTLKMVAAETGAEFFRATDTESLRAIYSRIDELEKTTRKLEKLERHDELYAYAMAPALVLVVLEMGLSLLLGRRIP
ncbi:MAG: VWA domain-containing protein [Deltaproteobacteria bacterium]|nr:VWA domain-containing protein [Deltaproteobacteria bacterium]